MLQGNRAVADCPSWEAELDYKLTLSDFCDLSLMLEV